MNYLDFEEPIRLLMSNWSRPRTSTVRVRWTCRAPWRTWRRKLPRFAGDLRQPEPVAARAGVTSPDRPYTLDHIEALTEGRFMELHGDRNCKDDKAMVGGLGMVDDLPVMFVGQQKGANTKLRQYRNFGMANPEGYRKALRLMKQAEKFNRPVVCLIDTPGAYPGLEAEERGQGEAIARNIYEMMQLRVPVICVIIGEGAIGRCARHRHRGPRPHDGAHLVFRDLP